MTKPQTTTDPLPCPFCGIKPRIEMGKTHHCQLHGEPYQCVVVRCTCTHAPRIEAGDIHNGGYEKAKEEAIQKWNMRA